MDKLGAFDQLFYKAEQYRVASMVMGGASILEPARPGEKLDAAAIADHLAARLQDIPLLRKKFLQDPIRIGTVRKVEDPQFDIRNHIFLDTLPKPGGYRELTQCIGELSAEPLPEGLLWRWTVVAGLRGGRLAVICKINHALADGVGLVEVLSSMYDPQPVDPEVPVSRPSQVTGEPGALGLLGDALLESAGRVMVKTPKFLMRNTGPLMSALGDGIRDLWEHRDALEERFAQPDVRCTSLDTFTEPRGRSISYKTLSLPEIKSLARHFNCKVNDIGLLLYSYAMQHYFHAIGEKVDFDLWCGMPISTRTEQSAEGGNQVTVSRVNLHNTIVDVTERLHAIREDSREIKNHAHPEDPLLNIDEVAELIFPPLIDGFLYLTGRMKLMEKWAETMTFANGLMSNVPGPPSTVYIANAAMVENIPMIPVVDVVAVSGGFVSVDKVITIGFHCIASVVEDPELFVRGVEQGLKDLHKAMAPPKNVRQRKPAKKTVRRQQTRRSTSRSGKRAGT
jgi:diacylglycerol O-acyltransferase